LRAGAAAAQVIFPAGAIFDWPAGRYLDPATRRCNNPSRSRAAAARAPIRSSWVSRKNYLFTSESVSEGHPDKVCDQISDAILDAFLQNDIKLGIADDSKVNTRLGCETLATTNKIVIAGEARGQEPFFRRHGNKTVVNRQMIADIARDTVKGIGYDQDGFSYYGADVDILLHGQSPDIAMGVDAKKKKDGEQEGAGDQGMMFGFACTESEVYEKNSFMPAPIYFAHKVLKVLSEKRRSGQLFDLQPDAKSQVTVRYVDGKPVGCTKVVVSTQHNAESRNGKKYTPSMVKEMIADAVASALPDGWMPKKASDFLVNPTGNFVIGGPDGDCGLTGRKIIVDTYGGYAPHGGGAFSGKDPTKVDRSAAYAARYLAKNVVAAGLADRCTIQIAYAIGVADPMSLLVDTHGTGTVDETKLQRVLPEIFPLRPTNIRRGLKLNRPIYRRTAAYGHFGRAPEKDGGFSWERTDLADTIRKAVS
jgi:S-adenosylmethionine synthetase